MKRMSSEEYSSGDECLTGSFDNEYDLMERDEKYRISTMNQFIYRKHIKVAEKGDLPLLIELQKKTGTTGNEYVCSMAACRGQLNIVEYMHSQGIPLSGFISFKACISGNVALLEYLHENNCPWHKDCILMAVENGHLEALRYLLENGAPENHRAFNFAISLGKLDIVKLLYSHGYEITEIGIYAAIEGYDGDETLPKCKLPDEEVYLEILIYLLERHNGRKSAYFSTAIHSKHLKMAKWLVENDYPTVYMRTDIPCCEYLQHKLGLLKCKEKCTYCGIGRIKKCRKGLYSEDGYGSWLSSDIIERLIEELY